jgi:hypothetical protein
MISTERVVYKFKTFFDQFKSLTIINEFTFLSILKTVDFFSHDLKIENGKNKDQPLSFCLRRMRTCLHGFWLSLLSWFILIVRIT